MRWPLVSRARFDALVALHSATAKKLDHELLRQSQVRAELRERIIRLEERLGVAERHIARLDPPPQLSSLPKRRLHRRILNALRAKAKRQTEPTGFFLDANTFRFHDGGVVRSQRLRG